MKPWKHAVICENFKVHDNFNSHDPIELNIRIECRNLEGERYPANDLELEIFRSGKELNLMVGWCNKLDRPMLWQGQHSVWMDSNNGQRCETPKDGVALEALARRLRTLFELPTEV